MARKLATTSEMAGVRVLGGKKGTKRMGKVRHFVFHPTEKRCVGFIVKRPDLLWMFKRKDRFVSIEGYDLEDGRIVIRNEIGSTDKAACKALDVNWDSCVLWVGLPVMTQEGQSFGMVGSVSFNRITGEVVSLETSTGAASNALLGKRTVPAELILGFKKGKGAALAAVGEQGVATDKVVLGAVLVSDQVEHLVVEGGVAEKAGEVSSIAINKVQTTVDNIKPAVSDAAKKTGKAVNKGAVAAGNHLSKSRTMFSDFKSEFDKAKGEGSEPKKELAPSKSKTAAKKKATKSAPKKQNVFSAFKSEYDKARHED